jgi:thioredoxin 1
MCRKMIYLTSFVLVLSVANNTSAELVAYWKFDEISGTVAHDSSGNGLDGTLRGDPRWVAGKIGGALDFDGTGDYVDCGNSTLFDIVDELTVSAWIYLRSVPGDWRAIIAKGDSAWRLSTEKSTQRMHFSFTGVGRGWLRADSVTWIPFNEWHHVCGVYDRQNGGCIYIDGVKEAINSNTGGIDVDTFNVFIGENSEVRGRYWDGLIDDIKVYNHALTSEEIRETMRGDTFVADNPDPKDGAYHAYTWVTLSWRPGIYAVSHDIYFGDNFDNVNDGIAGTFQGNQTATSFNVGLSGGPYPDVLVLDTTYYWRIDEVEADGTTVHKGDVWSFTISLVEDFETNDFSKFAWSSYGEQNWDTTRSERHSGFFSARSGSIEDGESTTLEVSLDCVSGDITFYRKVSSEGNCDYLKFYIDGDEKRRWSGEEDWSEVSFAVNEGTRTFEWTYSKDSSISEGEDTAWIDDIVFPIGLYSHRPQPDQPQPAGVVIELTDATFNQTVLRSDVPVLVDFWAAWCGPCWTMAPIIEEIADEYAGRAKICKLNVDNSPNSTTNYSIRFIPTFILFKNGHEQRRWIGVTNKNELTAAIDGQL